MSVLRTAALYPAARASSTTSSMSSMVRGAHALRRSQWTRSRFCSLPLPCCALHDSGGCGMGAAVVELDALAYCYGTRT